MQQRVFRTREDTKEGEILNFGQAGVVIRVRGGGALYGIVPLYGKIKTRALLSCFDKRGKGLAKLNTHSVSLICRCVCKIVKCYSTSEIIRMRYFFFFSSLLLSNVKIKSVIKLYIRYMYRN